ncbi:MAG: PAS domain-containing protein [Vicinamibacteria bacterium]
MSAEEAPDALEELRARVEALDEARDRLVLDQARAGEAEKEELEPIIQALHDGVGELTEELARRKRAALQPSNEMPAEQESAESSRELVRAVLETTPAALLQVDANGSIVLANGEALRLLELSFDAASGEFRGEWESRLFRENGEPCPGEDNPLRRCLRTGEAQPPTVFGIRRADATTALAVFRAAPLFDAERKVRASVVSALEIAER